MLRDAQHISRNAENVSGCCSSSEEIADGRVCIYRMAISPFSGEERNRGLGDLNGSFEREIMCAGTQQWKQSDSDSGSD